MHFGEHLMVDGYGGNKKLLDSKDLVLDILNELPKILQMKTLCKPCVFFAPDNHIKDPGGWSGFIVIAESHISVHTFPARGFVSADVYTCKNGLNTKLVSDYFIDKFQIKEIETNFIKRGMKYPDIDIQ